MTGYSQTGGGSNTISNQAANPSSVPVSQGAQGRGQQNWNSQPYNGASGGYITNPSGNPAAGGQNQGPYYPEQPQRDGQMITMGQSTPYQITENYDGAQMVTGSSPGSRTPTTAPPPFTQAPYSQSNVPNQGVFPTAPINVYPAEMSTTNGGAQGYQSSASATPYTTTPFPYGSTQHPNQGLYSENVISPSQGIYGTSTNYGPSTQSGSSMSTGQYTPSPYQTTGPQPSSSGFTPSGQTAQYTNQYDQGRMQTTQYGATSPQPPSSDYRTNNPQNQAVAVTPPSQQPFYDGSQGKLNPRLGFCHIIWHPPRITTRQLALKANLWTLQWASAHQLNNLPTVIKQLALIGRNTATSYPNQHPRHT
ncbi:hypothetical protein COOONC_10907 [Cooperia oncophora]